jgi:hypothetical protein
LPLGAADVSQLGSSPNNDVNAPTRLVRFVPETHVLHAAAGS